VGAWCFGFGGDGEIFGDGALSRETWLRRGGCCGGCAGGRARKVLARLVVIVEKGRPPVLGCGHEHDLALK
jgi:hypothetical protein